MNGYVCFYKSKRLEVIAETSLEAQKIAAAKFKAKHAWDVTVVLAEIDGKPVIHDGSEL